MPDLSLFASPAPYHILSYGTLLGSQVFQSFVAGIVAYRALPRPQFSSLQKAIFPIYFSMQTALPVALALTYPGERSSVGSSLDINSFNRSPSGLSGIFEANNRLHVLVPLATIFLFSMANLVVVGPATTRVMMERKKQETRDGKKSYDAAPHSKEMQALNRQFGKMHGISTLLNMVSCLATVWYGIKLAERL